MSDGLPTEEQLRSIRRGVQERIERRRRIARGIAGTTAGVLVVAGGIALLPRAGMSSGGATSAQREAGSAAQVEVRCRIGEPRTVTAPDDPVEAAAACDSVDFQSGEGRMPSAASASAVPQAASAGPATAVVCRAEDGALVVLPAGAEPATACERDGLQPY